MQVSTSDSSAGTLNDPSQSSPLAKCPDWVKVPCPKCGDEHARRDTDTLDTFVDSSWYFMRFLDPGTPLHAPPIMTPDAGPNHST